MDSVLDLDLLEDKARKVKLGGEVLTVTAPSLQELSKLLKVAEKMKNIQEDSGNIETLISDMTEILSSCIEGLKDKKVSIKQLLALIQITVELSMPDDTAELEKVGVTIDNIQKKI